MPTQYALTDYAERKALDAVFNDSERTYEVALFTVTPTETTSGTEVSTDNTGYARQTVTFSSAATVSSTTKVSNDATITFGSARSNWGTVTGAAVFDNLGNMLVFGNFEGGPVTVSTGNKVEIAVGALTITLD